MSDIRETIFGSGAGVAFIDAMFNSMDLLFALADVAYIPLSVAFGTLAPNVDWLSQQALQLFVAPLRRLRLRLAAMQVTE